jgi:diadenosine tetraphosphate (Ap4A) HIT family hydrolase
MRNTKNRRSSRLTSSIDRTAGTTINIHPQLLNDSLVIGRFTLSHLLLMNDANYPWFILVPDRDNITEVFQLEQADQQQLITESSMLSKTISEQFKADKINIAALGNMVPQLHIHHIVRYRNDAAWPAPVWGRHPASPYTDSAVEVVVGKLRQGLGQAFEFSM